MKTLPTCWPHSSLRALASMSLVVLAAASLTVPRAAHAAGASTVAIGTLAAVAAASNAPVSIEIPDAAVELLDPNGGTVASGRTQLDGGFRLQAPGPGKYSLCWKFQGRSACRTGLGLSEGPNALRTITARIEGPIVYGRVLTGDQRPCWVNDPFFKLDVSTRLTLLDGGGAPVADPARANVRGDYFFVASSNTKATVRAVCEKAVAKADTVATAAPSATNLTLPNHAPRIVELAASDGAKSRVRVPPGTVVKFSADVRDRDGDAVEYRWRNNDGHGLAAGNLPTLTRTAPARPGLQSNYLMARDGRGGYAFKRYDVEVGPDQIRVSGIAIDETTRLPIVKASVELVGGTVGTTNAQGWFSLTSAPNADDRYVLNIRHPNYALMSRVYDRSSTGATYELIAAQVKLVAPTSGLDLIDTGSGGPCGTVKGQEQQNPPTRLQTVEYIDPERGDAKPLDADYIRRLTATVPCQHLGARIIIKAGALARTDGKAIVGNIRAAWATLDPTRRALPGDYQAIDSASQRSELLSYGAVYAEFRDGAGAPLNLRSGATAEIHIPVPLAQRATAKPTIDFWSYGETTGRWVFEGQATLVSTASGPEYVGKTTHFSTLNMDVAGNDPAKATCVRFEVGASLSAWTNLKLRATVSYNGNAVQTKETFLDGQQYNAIYRIPFGTSFPPNTLRVELFGTFSGQSVVLVDNIINTDARPKMTGTNLWPPYPYSECGVPVTLNADPIALPAYAINDATGRPYFLTGPRGRFLPADAETKATAYYAAIDPAGAKDQLGKWWDLNGFDKTNGSGGTRAAYLNFNDLGFGRDMNCLVKPGTSNLACYVTNYGLANQSPANADAALAHVPGTQGATVAMEFDAAAGAEAVQFYVYANTGASSVRLKFADLDGFGPKPVPQLCVVCHGGDPTTLSPSGKVLHARFREFDLPSFKYSGARSWDYGASTLSATELANFQDLNQKVRATTPAGTPIHDLIDSWYTGGSAPQTPNAGNVPAGWAGGVAGYNAVYGKTCRTCHVARDGGATPPGFLSFDSQANFAGTSFAVCGLGRMMPNAIVTYKNFWADPARVLAYEALTGVPSGTCKND